MQTLLRYSFRRCSTEAVNVFAVVKEGRDSNGSRLVLRAFPHFHVNSTVNTHASASSIVISWPFLMNDGETIKWIRNSLKHDELITGRSYDNVPNIIVFSDHSLHHGMYQTMNRYLLPENLEDVSDFSLHRADTPMTDYQQICNVVSKCVYRPKKIDVFAVATVKHSRTICFIDTHKRHCSFTYNTTPPQNPAHTSLYRVDHLQEKDIISEKSACTFDQLLDYFSSKVNTGADESIIIVSTLPPHLERTLLKTFRNAFPCTGYFTTFACISRLFSAKIGKESFLQFSQRLHSRKYINKLVNASTQHEFLLTTMPELAKVPEHDNAIPPSLVFLKTTEQVLTLIHIQWHACATIASILPVQTASTEVLAFMEKARPSLLVFFDIGIARKKFQKILCSEVFQEILTSTQLWCCVFADLLIYGHTSSSDHTLHERMENSGIEIEWSEGNAEKIPPEISYIAGAIECFQAQWNLSRYVPNFSEDMTSWVKDVLYSNGENKQRFHKRTSSVVHMTQDSIKFQTAMLRNYIPPSIPVDLHHHWNWFSPVHLLPFVFGGEVQIGSDKRQHQLEATVSRSHVVVELSYLSGSLYNVSDRLLNSYARRRQIPQNKLLGNDAEIKAKIADSGPLHAYQALVYDIESTGLDTCHDKIVEIAIWDPQNDQAYESFVNPEMNIPPEVTSIHGISDEHVAEAPGFSIVAKQIVDFLKNIRDSPHTELLLIAHNGKKFDQKILQRHFTESNVAFPSFVHCLDSLPLLFYCKTHFPKAELQTLRLNSLVEQFGVDTAGALHRALTDAKSLWKVLEHLALTYGTKSVSSVLTGENKAEKIGYHAVMALVGHTIQDNITDGFANGEVDTAKHLSARVRFPHVDFRSEQNAIILQKLVRACELLRYTERKNLSVHVREKALNCFLHTAENFPPLSPTVRVILHLIRRVLQLKNTDRSTGET